MASAEAQSKYNAAVGQLPTNKDATVPADDPFLVAGFDMLSSAYALAQFFDRDAPAEMAKAGMEGFQQFMVQPDQLDNILNRLEQIRGQVYN
jgi:multiple sugar transport system substrate-binding protein